MTIAAVTSGMKIEQGDHMAAYDLLYFQIAIMSKQNPS